MFIATHPQTSGEFQDLAQESGAKAQGSALAHLFMKYVEDNAKSLKQCLRDLASLHDEGRREFRLEVDAIRKERNKFVKAAKGSPEHDRLKKVNQSATVRLSEAVIFSKALDMGFVPDWDQSYHTLVTDARIAMGSSAKKGGVEETPLQKAKKYLAKLEMTQDDRNSLLEFVAGGCVESLGEDAPI